MSQIKAIIFDFGGVIVSHGFDVIWEKFWQATSIWKIPALFIFAFIYLPKIEKGTMTEVQAWEKLKKFFKKDQELTEVRKEILDSYRLNERIMELTLELKNKYQVALLTNNLKEWMDHFEAEFRLSHYFSIIVNSAEVGLRKPDPQIYHLILKKLNLKASECIFIDDHRRNLWPANALGFQTIHFKNNPQFKKDLNRILTQDQN